MSKRAEYFRQYSKRYRDKNADKVKAYHKARYDEGKQRLHAYIERLSCRRCGVRFDGNPTLCNFHHPNVLQKSSKYSGRVSLMAQRGNWKAVVDELSVTVPMCVHCHQQMHKQVP